MSETPPSDADLLRTLEGRIEELTALCRHLREDNAKWRARHQALSSEHARLSERARQARARIEEVIGRVAVLTGERRS
ncbi:MAG: TIGR02449 family protein [Gammaproteobacteria bacterium]|nr:TIGR02449 family protein [Gammaproteobacteria bacterium]